MDANATGIGVDDPLATTAADQDGLSVDDVAHHVSVVTLPSEPGSDSSSVSVPYTEQHCELLKEGEVEVHDDGEVLLVQGLEDFQDVVSTETVVVDESQSHASLSGLPRTTSYQQYQPLVVQGFVTSSGEVVHVVQQDVPTSSGHRTMPTQTQSYQHSYQQPMNQMMHPDLYRLIKMFPDFSTKTLHRIFVMCHCDLKRALDQALFARQFRQLDSAPSYNPVAPSSASATHFHPASAPYRSPTRAAYMQMGADLSPSDAYLSRGRTIPMASAQARATQASQQPILLYPQTDPRLNKQTSINSLGQTLVQQGADDPEVVQIKLGDLSADEHVPANLGDGLGLLAGAGTVIDGSSDANLGPGGDSLIHCSKTGDKSGLVQTPGSDSTGVLLDQTNAVMKDSSDVIEVETS